jgi:LacI family transcriptional regulator
MEKGNIMKVTIKDIAKIANVSRSTVDKVLHNRVGVSDEVRERVKNIIDELDYKPNMIAKALTFQKKPLVIGVIATENDFFNEAKQGIYAAYKELKDFGLKIEYYSMKDFDVDGQLSIIEQLRNKQISGLAIRPLDHPKIRDAINEMVESNIPVVTFNSDIVSSKRMCFVGQDLVKAGNVAGELMGKLLNGRGKVAIITGSHSLLALKQRIEGFKEVIEKEFPDIQIVREIETLEQREVTFQKTLSLLKSIEDIKGLYVTGQPINEVGKAVKIMGKSKQIIIGCFDLYPETIDLVKQGVVDFTIGQDPFAQGYKPIKVLFEYLFNKKYPKENHIKTQIDIRIKSNII